MRPSPSRVQIAVVIPAYQPGVELSEVVRALIPTFLSPIIVVDDGSGAGYAGLFGEVAGLPEVTVLRHERNLGKGAALKTGFDYVLRHFPGCAGIVTADADGQHAIADILAVAGRFAQDPGVLVLGSREFDRSAPVIPWKSRLGNGITRHLVRWLVGRDLQDTQTGLRAIPLHFVRTLLRVGSGGYEFELDMLIASKHHRIPIVEEPIRTIYKAGNPSSHFDPLLDSLKVYFVLFRFSVVSLLTAIIDNTVFIVAFGATSNIAAAQLLGRAAACCFNYPAARKAVFLSSESHAKLLGRYLLLVLCSSVLSYLLIHTLLSGPLSNVVAAKVVVESLLFFVNFVLQRDFVFNRTGDQAAATDWDRYYERTVWTAKLTRRYTTSVLISVLHRIFPEAKSELAIVEIGGANSCFLSPIISAMHPRDYHVIDLNEFGLELLRTRLSGKNEVHLHCGDVRDFSMHLEANLVFSVGLIEHFDGEGTRRAIQAHFRMLKPGGYAILSFPTPTGLYRVARWFAELAGVWQFPDERPLLRNEVLQVAEENGRLVYEKILWPLVFTQLLLVIQKPDPVAGA